MHEPSSWDTTLIALASVLQLTSSFGFHRVPSAPSPYSPPPKLLLSIKLLWLPEFLQAINAIAARSSVCLELP